MADDTKALWHEFRKSKDRALRDRLILTYAPLVKFVAGRLGSGLPAHVDEGDLVSYGLLGLIGAIERYDPDRDVKFETYAISRIKGAIIDELRAMDWVPRSVRARGPRHRARDRAPRGEAAPRADRRGDRGEARDHDRRPRRQPDRHLPLLDRGARRALDDVVRLRRPGLADRHDRGRVRPQPAQALDQTELREALGEAIARLPEREKLVITLYYYEELTLAKSARCSASPSRASRSSTRRRSCA
jgi:RNA polymerase sigma factor for flagellar operon FliA